MWVLHCLAGAATSQPAPPGKQQEKWAEYLSGEANGEGQAGLPISISLFYASCPCWLCRVSHLQQWSQPYS